MFDYGIYLAPSPRLSAELTPIGGEMLPRVSFQAFTRFCTADGQKTGKIANVSSLHVEDEDKCSLFCQGFFISASNFVTAGKSVRVVEAVEARRCIMEKVILFRVADNESATISVCGC